MLTEKNKTKKMSKDYLDKWEERQKQNTEIIDQQQAKTKKINVYKIKYALRLAKDCTYADEITEGAKEHLRNEIDEALQELNQINENTED